MTVARAQTVSANAAASMSPRAVVAMTPLEEFFQEGDHGIDEIYEVPLRGDDPGPGLPSPAGVN